ncbi:hypothetical protein TRIUR3_12271 [Triticum urartu]|uniref:Uncharacterized protein n=1 Tax=Triticum urartu TaxID=4572 RepID=M7ZZU2_TRIUA|nr:hypothetical protein TRIUR3_12271 [Triticum urartu]
MGSTAKMTMSSSFNRGWQGVLRRGSYKERWREKGSGCWFPHRMGTHMRAPLPLLVRKDFSIIVAKRESDKRKEKEKKIKLVKYYLRLKILSETNDAIGLIWILCELSALPSEQCVSGAGRCDLFHGEWVHDSTGPAYTNATCRFIETPQNCMSNGRPDDGYLYWKWKPYGCDVPRFESKTFLEDMRGKHWALVGDSILRNHVQSLLCLLSKVEDPTEVYHDKTYQSRRWHFPSHNFTLSLVWAPFLVKAEIFEDENGVSSAEPRLTFDVLDATWVSQWASFDYVIISTGQWFFKKAVYLEHGASLN